MTWKVEFTGRARKQKEKLPLKVREILFQLVRDIEAAGPVRGDGPITPSCQTVTTTAT